MPTSITPPPAEDEVECARCGSYVHISLTRCPHCGVNFYEPDDDEDNVRPVSKMKQGFGGSIKSFIHRIMGNEPHPAEMFLIEAQRQKELYDDLLRRVGGEREMVERLVEFERQKIPTATRTTCLENAIRRWERDNQ